MKCSACYADNALWATVCVMCGQPVLPVELCPNGHILPPGSRECPICPSMWPEAPAFSGPAVLRGVLVPKLGHIVDESGAGIPYLEVRDIETPFTFVETGPDRIQLIDPKSTAGVARLLMRPDGLRICRKGGGPGGKMAYELVQPDSKVTIGGVRLQAVSFEVPVELVGAK